MKRNLLPEFVQILNTLNGIKTEKAFISEKNTIDQATFLRHPIYSVSLCIWVDASDVAIGGTRMQFSQNRWELKAFFCVKLIKNQQDCSTYDRELFSIYSSIRKIHHMLEGKNFQIYTDQKRLIYAFKQNPHKCSLRQLHPWIISLNILLTLEMCKNTVANARSRIRIDSITKSPILNFQRKLSKFCGNSRKWSRITISAEKLEISQAGA